MVALLEARVAGLLTRPHWLPNIVSGVIVGVVALPLAMAFAIASGARPEQGLYTAIIGGGLVSLLGGSRLQIAGPTGAFVVIMGAARLGVVMKFIPAPVIVGFTAGIGVIIFVGRWRDFRGLPATDGAH